MRRYHASPFRYALAIAAASTTFSAIAGDLPHEQLIYTTLRPANKELYLFEPGAAAPKPITNDPALDYPKVEDAVRGMAFVEAVVKSSKKNAAWTKLDV